MRMPTEVNMLHLESVSRQFGGLRALSNVSLEVTAGRIVGLIGPNGAGKTTLINCISGLDHPTSGQIAFQGVAIQQAPPHEITRLGIARTYQNIRLFGRMTARENLLIGQHVRGRSSLLGAVAFTGAFRREERLMAQRAGELLQRFDLMTGADTPASALPYGDQRRLELARALATQPKLLLLDEPTAGMNPVETHTLGDAILQLRAEGLSMLVIEHDMTFIHQVCDEIYVLNFGQIIAHGSPDAIKAHPAVIEAYLGTDDDDGAA
jgi:ABC-type branched-subunit amino acid transport system ATPase component